MSVFNDLWCNFKLMNTIQSFEEVCEDQFRDLVAFFCFINNFYESRFVVFNLSFCISNF